MKLFSPAFLAILALAIVPGCSAHSASPVITDTKGLVAALAAAKGGETIRLAVGEYDRIGLTDRHFSTPVTITSVDPAHPAHIANLWLWQVDNLTVRSISLGSALAPGEADYVPINRVVQSHHIVFDHVHIHGSLDGDPSNDGFALYVYDSDDISVVDSEIEQAHRAVVFERTADILIRHNHIHDIRSDGGDYTAVENVIIDGNLYHDFFPKPGDHPDIVQFWTNGQKKGSSNIQIINNQNYPGKGQGIQGIFIRDENGGMPHKNIVIRNNMLYSIGTHWEGISVSDASDVVVQNNTVLSVPDDEPRFWIKLANTQHSQVSDNVSDWVVDEKANRDIQLKNNISLHDAPGQAKQIPNLRAGAAARMADFMVSGRGYSTTPVAEIPWK